ncbi:UPF0496 protein At3g19330 isoform X1 [Arachis ipaensis]|uniref:UPF0496 protein At3g19330 isoform X1 n=1 Tax=Arachis ipaensis TaxID=130454 RepID=UPI000A2B4D3D|nr:UPF0496 protein At3g19330 isoform X1 [Arachis ipaensis]XP_025654368.1 UPF0496 protein At3g19330 isoform X2 [Arachis hypogaea]
MRDCLFLKSFTNSSSGPASVPSLPPSSHGDNTPSTSSSTASVSREYNLTVQAKSYAEIRSMMQGAPAEGEVHLLNPDGDCVNEALNNNTIIRNRNGSLTSLISTYFNHTETASQHCLRLHRCVDRARAMYAPLFDLRDSHDCDRTFDLFVQFDGNENPFPDSNVSSKDIRNCLTDLRNQLDFGLGKSRSRIRLFRRATAGSALCFVATAVGVAAAAVALTIHAVFALAAAAGPFCSAYIPNPSCAAEKREVARLAQLDAAAKGAYVLSYDLDTIDRLVARLHTTIEGDKLLVRMGLERGRASYPIQEVFKLLCKNNESFLRQLDDLAEHICLCIYTVNKSVRRRRIDEKMKAMEKLIPIRIRQILKWTKHHRMSLRIKEFRTLKIMNFGCYDYVF